MPTGGGPTYINYHDYVERPCNYVERTNPVPEWLKKHIKPGREERAVLHEILTMTNHDAPGIYEPETIERVNTLARKILGMPVVSDFAWPHNQPNKDPGPKSVSRHEINRMILAGAALEKLSGDLSYDNVAAVKEILRLMID